MFHGWWIVGVAMLMQAMSIGLAIYAYGLLVTPIGAEFGASRLEMMWGKTGLSLMTILVSPFIGALLDRRSTRALMILGSLALGAAFVLISVSRSVWEFTVAYAVLIGVASALLGTLGTNALVTRWFATRRGRALSLTALGSSIGGLAIPYLFQTMIDAYGWRSACLYIGVIAVALLVPAIAILVRNRPADLGLHPVGAATTSTLAVQGAPEAAGSLLRSVRFWQIALTVGAVFAAYTALLVNIVPFAQGQGIASKQAALLISVLAISGVGGKILFGVVADHINVKAALIVVMVMLAPPILVLVGTSDYQVILICAIVLGLAAGSLMPGWAVLLAQVYGPLHYGRVMGRMLPVIGIMGTIIVPFVGFLFDRRGDYVIAFLFLAILVVVSTIFLAPIRYDSVRRRDLLVQP